MKTLKSPRLFIALVLALLAATAQDDRATPLQKPIEVGFRLESEAKMVRGSLSTWDETGFSGTFVDADGRHEFITLDLASFRRVFRRLMDVRSAQHWLLFGELLGARPDEASQRFSRNAFDRALRLDKTIEGAVLAAQALIAEAARLREDEARQRAAERLRENMPEGLEWEAKPWPTLTIAEEQEALQAMRASADKILTQAGFPDVRPVETKFFLLYSDLSNRKTASIARDLDLMYAKVADMLGIPSTFNLFWGKAVILICRDNDRFRLIETQAFNQMTPPGVTGLCHCVGPQVFVNTFYAPDELRFFSTLVHETVHGIMHRYISPARLPTWANEGLSEYIAAHAFSGSPVDASRRGQGLNFFRSARWRPRAREPAL